jgi:dTDP-glucose 4,6-dehydratase/UDP-glucose 4,6-dehydratase|uniref:NAD(P)-binding domain-containing protein n=1 Tax=viral metagenome TaxID=1070528 RepID=A0A6C0LXX2_9ZZZZ
MSILITGGCGFIGSNYINNLLKSDKFNNETFDYIINIDKLDYCSNKDNVNSNDSNKYIFIEGSICDKELLKRIFNMYNILYIVHFAAQTHVDNSFDNSINYTIDNILGTHQLIECCRLYGTIKKFIHISTDEVYGEISINSEDSTEVSLLNPTNPYAATKAGAEFIVRSYYYSYNMPIIIIRCNNVYGANQYPEKIIPKFITLLRKNKKMSIHGNGLTRRNFIYVDDVINAINIIAIKGEINNVYNIGSEDEYNVIEIATILLNHIKGAEENIEDWVEYIKDRNFNDFRYSINTTKLNNLGWKKTINFKDGIKKTVYWYINNENDIKN